MTKHALTFLVFRSLACWFVIVAANMAATLITSLQFAPMLQWLLQLCLAVGVAHAFWRDASRLSGWITRSRGTASSLLAAIGIGVIANGIVFTSGLGLMVVKGTPLPEWIVWPVFWAQSAAELLSGLALFLASRPLGNWVDARSITAEEIARFVAENDINPVPQSDA